MLSAENVTQNVMRKHSLLVRANSKSLAQLAYFHYLNTRMQQTVKDHGCPRTK